MKITTKIEVYCPSGFYCQRVGSTNRCSRLNTTEHKQPYCELFYPFVKTDSIGNILKCEECLLAERKARLSK